MKIWNRKLWIEEIIFGSPQKEEPTFSEYEKAFKKWRPKNNIPFDELVKIIFYSISLPFVEQDDIIGSFEEVFNQIEDGYSRMTSLILFCRSISHYKRLALFNKGQKNGRYNSYCKNSKEKIKSNKKAAEKVLASLVQSGAREGTKTAQLFNLLNAYIEQSDKMLNSDKLITKPLEIKNYKFISRANKQKIRDCLEMIIKKYNIKINKHDILKTEIDKI